MHFYNLLPINVIIIPNCLYYCTVELDTTDFMLQFVKSYDSNDKHFLMYKMADATFSSSSSSQESLQLINIKPVFSNVLSFILINLNNTNISLGYGTNAFCLERIAD